MLVLVEAFGVEKANVHPEFESCSSEGKLPPLPYWRCLMQSLNNKEAGWWPLRKVPRWSLVLIPAVKRVRCSAVEVVRHKLF